MAQGVEVPNTATTAFCCFLQSLLSDLGNEESQSKACPPTTRTTCLGVEFDTLAMTKWSVHPNHLEEIQELLKSWSHKKRATKRELQSLIGKFSFVSKCVKNSRIFLMHIIDLIKGLIRALITIVSLSTANFRKTFVGGWILLQFTTACLSSWIPHGWSRMVFFATDTCLIGCSGICGDRFFSHPFSRQSLPEVLSQSLALVSCSFSCHPFVGLSLGRPTYSSFLRQWNCCCSQIQENEWPINGIKILQHVAICFVARVRNQPSSSLAGCD